MVQGKAEDLGNIFLFMPRGYYRSLSEDEIGPLATRVFRMIDDYLRENSVDLDAHERDRERTVKLSGMILKAALSERQAVADYLLGRQRRVSDRIYEVERPILDFVVNQGISLEEIKQI